MAVTVAGQGNPGKTHGAVKIPTAVPNLLFSVPRILCPRLTGEMSQGSTVSIRWSLTFGEKGMDTILPD
jgi:hypothetical protein